MTDENLTWEQVGIEHTIRSTATSKILGGGRTRRVVDGTETKS